MHSQLRSAWERNCPAIISTHRINFVNLVEERRIENLRKFQSLLDLVNREYPDAVYLVDNEVEQLYRKGASLISIGPNEMRCRNYSGRAIELDLKCPADKVRSVRQAPGGRTIGLNLQSNGGSATITIPPGDYDISIG